MMALSSATFLDSSAVRLWATSLCLAVPCLGERRDHFRTQAAARSKFARDSGTHRPAGFHDIAQEAVDHVLLKDAEIAISQGVHLERLELEAKLVGDVVNRDGAE